MRTVLTHYLTRSCLVTGLLVASLVTTNLAAAQTNASLQLSVPDASAFPTITAYLQVYDAQGNFMRGLEPGGLTILEDDQPVALQQLEERRVGTRLLVAINPGPGLGARNAEGITRYEPTKQALLDWTGKLSQNEYDEFSLVTNEGSAVTFSPDPKSLQAAIRSYESDMRSAQPSLVSLARAVDQASDPTPRPGMSRAILYITTAPETDQLAALQDITGRAQGLGVRLFIWLAASADMLETFNVRALEQAAASTGGSFFFFTGSETFPEIQSYTNPLGSIYALSYRSIVKTSGTHQVAVSWQAEEQEITSLPQFFSVEVLPPNPIFISPPAMIERTCPSDSAEPLAALEPREYELKVLVEFPDNHPRPLVWSRLYVNGALADENTQPPFDEFTWDLTGCDQTDRYLLRVEISDSLGMTAASIDTPVEVMVSIPPPTALEAMQQKGTWLIALAFGAAGVLVAGVLLFFWRRSTRQVNRPVRRRVPEIPRANQNRTRPQLLKLTKEIIWHKRTPPEPRGEAQLEQFDPGTQPVNIAQLIGREITVGRDPEKAMLVIDLPCLDELHARLRQTEDGSYLVLDQNSTGGTWVNYQPVGMEGIKLQHDDMLHFGKAAFHYRASQPGAPKRVHTRIHKDT